MINRFGQCYLGIMYQITLFSQIHNRLKAFFIIKDSGYILFF